MTQNEESLVRESLKICLVYWEWRLLGVGAGQSLSMSTENFYYTGTDDDLGCRFGDAVGEADEVGEGEEGVERNRRQGRSLSSLTILITPQKLCYSSGYQL